METPLPLNRTFWNKIEENLHDPVPSVDQLKLLSQDLFLDFRRKLFLGRKLSNMKKNLAMLWLSQLLVCLTIPGLATSLSLFLIRNSPGNAKTEKLKKERKRRGGEGERLVASPNLTPRAPKFVL